MDDLYNTFINLSLQQCSLEDYSNKQKVRIHNVATKKLMVLKKRMAQCDCNDIILKLLNEHDDRVMLNAAVFCVENNILYEQAIHVLSNLRNNAKDATVRLSAQMMLNRSR